MDLDEKWNYLIDTGYLSNDTYNLITGIWGNNENTLNDVIFYLFAVRSWDDLMELENQE